MPREKSIKPYSNARYVTAELIRTHPYFLALTRTQLMYVLNTMRYSEVNKLPGTDAGYRADALMQGYAKRIKKGAVVPVLPKKVRAPKKVYSYRSFLGYHLTRTKTQLRFGCGAVTVNKADLLRMGELVHKLGDTEPIKEVLNNVSGNQVNVSYLRTATPAQLAFLKSDDFPLVSTLYTKARARISSGDFFSITAEQYKKLAE